MNSKKVDLKDKNLKINIRKRIEKEGPPKGELVQGIFFSLYSAIDLLEAAENMFDQKKSNVGYMLLISAIEEIGKINHYVQIIFSWDRRKWF